MSSRRDPRWRKLMQWRRHGWNGVRHGGCSGCEWCIPESAAGYSARERREAVRLAEHDMAAGWETLRDLPPWPDDRPTTTDVEQWPA